MINGLERANDRIADVAAQSNVQLAAMLAAQIAVLAFLGDKTSGFDVFLKYLGYLCSILTLLGFVKPRRFTIDYDLGFDTGKTIDELRKLNEKANESTRRFTTFDSLVLAITGLFIACFVASSVIQNQLLAVESSERTRGKIEHAYFGAQQDDEVAEATRRSIVARLRDRLAEGAYADLADRSLSFESRRCASASGPRPLWLTVVFEDLDCEARTSTLPPTLHFRAQAP